MQFIQFRYPLEPRVWRRGWVNDSCSEHLRSFRRVDEQSAAPASTGQVIFRAFERIFESAIMSERRTMNGVPAAVDASDLGLRAQAELGCHASPCT